MSDSYANVVDSFLKLAGFYLDDPKFDVLTKDNKEATFILDTLEMRLDFIGEGKKIVEQIANDLRKVGFENIEVTDQYYGSGADLKIYNAPPPGSRGGGDNKPKLAVIIPLTEESADRLGSAYRTAVEDRATEILSKARQEAKKMVARTLGADGELAWQNAQKRSLLSAIDIALKAQASK